MALDQEVKAEIIAKHRRDDKDTGSAEVQIAVLSEQMATKRVSGSESVS